MNRVFVHSCIPETHLVNADAAAVGNTQKAPTLTPQTSPDGCGFTTAVVTGVTATPVPHLISDTLPSTVPLTLRLQLSAGGLFQGKVPYLL